MVEEPKSTNQQTLSENNFQQASNSLELKEPSETEENHHLTQPPETKLGEFMITNLQALIINKLMPVGVKLELEETYLKSAEVKVFIGKKRKVQDDTASEVRPKKKKKRRYSDFSEPIDVEKDLIPRSRDVLESKPSSSKKPKRRNEHKEEVENNNHNNNLSKYNSNVTNNSNNNNNNNNTHNTAYNNNNSSNSNKAAKGKDPKTIALNKACENVLLKVRKHQQANFFLESFNPAIPCLNDADRKIKGFVYTAFPQFAMEIRKIWQYHFSNCMNNNELYQRTYTMSQFFETLLTEAEESEKEALTKEAAAKEKETLAREKEKPGVSKPTPRKERTNDKPMTITEKNVLGNNIRQLTPEQLKGIIHILSDQNSVEKGNKFFEFDIDKLSNSKLRDLDKYVKQCLKAKGGVVGPSVGVVGASASASVGSAKVQGESKGNAGLGSKVRAYIWLIWFMLYDVCFTMFCLVMFRVRLVR
jgi:hypothetical protein